MAVSPVTPPLLAVVLVFRSNPKFDGLDHVITAVSAYADSSVEQPMHKACKFGSVALLDRIWNSTVDLEPGGWGLWSVRNLLRSQKLYGKLEFSLCLLEAKVICEAAKAGALEILHFFRDNDHVISNDEEEDDEYREERENSERQPRIRFGSREAARAVLAKHAKWMYAVYEQTANDHNSINAASSTGNVELAHWVMGVVEMDLQCRDVLHGAAANGNVEILQWFQDYGNYTEWDAGTLVKAAEAGKLNVVQWIIDRDRQDDTLGYESGPNEYDTGTADDERQRRTYITRLGGEASLAIHAAAINGHLEVAKYLHAKIDKPRKEAEEQTEKRRLRQKN